MAVDDRLRHNKLSIPEHIWTVLVEANLLEQGEPEELGTDAVGLFHLGDLLHLSTGRVTLARIERVCELINDSSAPAHFD